MKHRIDGLAQNTLFTGQERILFVDDEELFADMECRMLARHGYKVTYTANSAEALNLFCFQPEEFDLVITGFTMPVMTGTELAHELLKIRPDIPIILCTASSAVSSTEAARLGIRGVMMKPLDSTMLAKVIRTMLDGNSDQAKKSDDDGPYCISSV